MPATRDSTTRKDRLRGWAMVAAVYAIGGVAWWLAPHHADAPPPKDEPAVMIDVENPPSPPEIETPQPKPARARKEGAAGKKAEPSPVVAPEPKLAAPSPIPAAPVAGTGNTTTAGSAERGTGTGAGGRGNGRGGGAVTAPRWVSGGLRDSDYPRSLVRGGVSGNVSVRFTVLTSGRIANCRIARSSGSPELDALTCRLLTERLQFVPAQDAGGHAVPFDLGNDYGWGIRRRGG